jgi:uncharacterized protein (TIGR00725 family)
MTDDVRARRPPVVAVIGAGDCDDATQRRAEEVGRLLAQAGAIVVTGGLGGVMEGASKGAKEAGGLVIGVLPGRSADEANRYVEVPIVTGLGEARNAVIANTADAFIVVAGGWGTLSEIAFAMRLGKRVVSLGAWSEIEGVRVVGTAAEAVALALAG